MANLIKIDTTGYTSDYILLLDSPSSVGRYVTVKDTGTNPTFFASNAIVISTTSGYTFFDGNSTEYIRTNKGSLSFLTTTSNWRLLNTVPYTTLGHAVLSTISTKNMSVFGGVSSFAQVTVQNIMQVQAIDTQNVATVNAIPVVTASNMASTVAGLGTLAYLSSISFMNNYFASTVNGLGTYGIISSSLLTSSMQGLGPPYVSSTWLTSTMQGLGTLGYVSYSQFNSSIIGITLGFRSNIGSTVSGLGTFGYISSQSLVSSIRDLGQQPYTYISSKQLQSTTAGITTFNTTTLVSTVQGLGQIYISTQGLVSTTVGISNVNAANITSTINNLGLSYISSLSLQSTVAGLGTLGYISISQLTSTMTGLSNATVAANTSIDNLGTNQYISAPSLVSSVVGLGSAPYSYISGPSLISTVNGLGSVLLSTPSLLEKATALTNSVYNMSPITSTMNGLGNYYLSTSGDYTVVGRLGVYLGGINGITRAGNTPTNRTVTTVASGFNYPVGVAVDSTGVYVADSGNNLIRLYTPAGVSTYASVSSPHSIAIDAAGNLYVADSANGRIVKIDAARNITYAGNVYYAYGVAVDSRGTIYATSYGTDQVFQIIGGTVTVLAGSGANGYLDGDANSAQFNRPYAVAVDSADNIFVADTNNARIRQIKSSLVISLVQATSVPGYMVMDGAGNIYYTIPSLHVIMKRDTAGNVTTYAGSGIPGSADGIPGSFFNPQGLAIDSAGNIYVADRKNNAVRMIDTSGNVTTVFSGGSYPQALNWPQGVAVDSSGIYVADTGNSRICSIVPASVGPSSTVTQYVTTATGGGGASVYATMRFLFYGYAYSGKVGDSTYTYFKYGPYSTPGYIIYASVSYAVSATLEANAPPLSANVYWVGGQPYNIGDPLAVYTTFTNAGPPYTATLVAGFDEIGYIHITGTPQIYYNTGIYVNGSTISQYPISITIPSGTITVVLDSRVSGDFIRGTRSGTGFAGGYASDGSQPVYVGAWLAITNSSGTYVCVTDSSWRRADSFTGSTLATVTIPGAVIPPSLNVIAGQSGAIVSTFAGDGTVGSANGPALSASFNYPMGVAVDSAGNVYVSDSLNNVIRKISGGVVSTFAGSGAYGFAGGPLLSASFAIPSGLTFDPSGNLYVVDVGYNLIRKIAAGNVSTLAGSGTAGYTDGFGSSASFNTIEQIATDSSGNIYVADYYNHVIRRVTPAGMVSTFAGNGTQGYADGALLSASFNSLSGVAFDSVGNLYVADSENHLIRKISGGVVSTFAGDGFAGSIGGSALSARFNFPQSLSYFSGSLYVKDTGLAPAYPNPGPEPYKPRIRKIILATGEVSTVAGDGTTGSTNGSALSASFYFPMQIAADSTGNVYVADAGNNLVRKIMFGSAGYADGNGTAAQFNGPRGIRLDASHNIYVADTGNNIIRKVDPSANVTTIAGQVTAGLTNGVGAAAQFNFPTDVALDGTNIYVADYANNVIRKIDSTQKVTIYGGSPVGASGNSLNAPGLFSGPIGVFVSGSYLYFTEEGNSDIKRMFGGTVVSTVASGLSSPTAIAFDSAGTMYVTDNHRVITIPNTAYAGTGSAGSANGIWSSATFNSPEGIAIDSAGIVYVADSGNNLLRKIAPSATNNTLFYANSTDIWRLTLPATSFYLTSTTNLNGGLAYDGTTIYATRDNSIYAYNTLTTASYTLVGSSAGYANGTSGVYFNMPIGLAIDSSGQNLYVCDYFNGMIRRVQISPLSVTTVASVSNPIAIALDSYSRYAYVTNFDSFTSVGSVYRVSLLQGNTTQIASGLVVTNGITIDPTNTYAYITQFSIGKIIQINLQTFATQTIAGSGANASIDGISLAASFALPYGIIYDPTTALMYSTDYWTGLIRTITTPIYLSTILGLEVIRTAPTITGTLTISGATVGGLLYNSGGPTASANVIIGKGITLKTDLRAGNSTVTAKTFTASAGTSAGPYGYYYGDGSHVTSISDVRTKEDIRPIRNALSIVRKLQAVEYTKRDDPTRRWIGYIAQDIEELLPELVTTDDSPEKWKSVQYTNLPGLIIEAIKELKEKYRILSYAANI